VRRNVGLVLIGVGAFFIALAPLIRFYVVRQVIVAPANVFQRTTLQAVGASYLDAGSGTMRRGVTLTATNTVRGDTRASGHDIAVWESFTSIDDPVTRKNVEIQQQRAAFDRRTARLSNVRGASVGEDPSVRQSGIGIFWPIGVKKQTYQYFDIATKRPWPMVYQGEERIRGVKAYRFVQHITPTVNGSIPGGVPAAMLGVAKAKGLPGYDAKTGNLAVDKAFEATVTVWIDPRTGVKIGQEHKSTTRLRTKDGVDRLVVADLDLKLTDASQRDLVKRSNHEAGKITLAKVIAPLAAIGLGVVLLAIGLAIVVPARRTILSAPEEEKVGADSPRAASPQD